ncbi:MAG: T9SS type A sorting domain-containing protein [candidate division WOR-3 bacterium]|nr:T9SS type A sorting domain-containing protein [candidate division WOR-3 bacterium]
MKRTFLLITILIAVMLFAYGTSDPADGENHEDYFTKWDMNGEKWADDLLVDSGWVGGFAYATDYNSGVIYALKKNRNFTIGNDSVRIFKSNDNGINWSSGQLIMTNPDGYINDPAIVVTNSGKIACFALYIEGDNQQNIWMREFTDSSLSSIHWEEVSVHNQDTVINFDVDYSDGYYYVSYLAYNGTSDTVHSLYGTTAHEDSVDFTNQSKLFHNIVEDEEVRVAAGTGGIGYIAFIEDFNHPDTLNIRVKRTFNYGDTWAASEPITNLLSGQQIENIDIACCKPNPKTVWITTQYTNLNNWGYYYSTDSCNTAGYGGVIQLYNGAVEALGTVQGHPGRNWATFAFRSDSGSYEHIGFFYIMNSNPDSVINLQAVNNYRPTGTFRPEAGNSITNSAVMYAGWGPENLYYDAYNLNTGIDENRPRNTALSFIAPARTMISDEAEFSLLLDSSSEVMIALYDCSGRKVLSRTKNLSEGSSTVSIRTAELPSGIYLYRAQSGVKTASGRLVKIR